MNLRRFELRPIASRRLRAALLLVLLLSLVGISQTRLSGVQLVVAILALAMIFADGWRRTRIPHCALNFCYRPLGCSLLDQALGDMALRCRRVSVYPWLIVLQLERDPQAPGHLPSWLHRAVVLLPDSLSNCQDSEWRRLLIWARLTRRQLANR